MHNVKINFAHGIKYLFVVDESDAALLSAWMQNKGPSTLMFRYNSSTVYLNREFFCSGSVTEVK